MQDILAGCKEVFSLSPRSGLVLERLSSTLSQESHSRVSGSGDSCPGFSEELAASVSSTESNPVVASKHSTPSAARPLTDDGEPTSYECSQDESPEPDDGAMELSRPASPPAISLLSPKAMEMAGCIIKFQQQQREKAKVRKIMPCIQLNVYTMRIVITVAQLTFKSTISDSP